MSRRSALALPALAVAAALALAARPAAAQDETREPGTTGLTIYNDGRVLVRRAVPLRVPRGASEHRVSLGRLDPGSLTALDDGTWITGLRYDGAVDEDAALRRSVGRELEFLLVSQNGGTDTLTATVLGVDPIRLQLPGGGVAYRMPGYPLYPADVAAQGPEAIVSLQSGAARDSLRLAWFTNGASWHASYDVVLGREAGRVTGKAVIDSRSVSATDASVQLVGGDVGRAMQEKTMEAYDMAQVRTARAAAPSNALEEQSVGEVHLYTLPGRVTIRPGQTTSRALFEPARVEWQRRYVVPGQPSYWEPLPRQGQEERPPVEVRYDLKRPRDGEFGRRPLPAGIVRLYQPDAEGRLQMIGETSVTHTPAGQDLELTAGTAFDITARRIQTSYDVRQEPIGQGAVRTIATAAYEVTLTNATDGDVTVTVVESRGGDWDIVESSVPARRVSSTRAEFSVPVPEGGSATLRYTVRATW
jgi:hypothetical protein